MLTFGSLFAGIGGIDLGFERAGLKCKWQVEIDPFCQKVLTKHWPAVPKFEDIRECGDHNLEYVDVIVGGFPCQDISLAGKGAGIEGEQSGLWTEFARIIRDLRPKYAVMENVSALLVRGVDRVLGDLAEIGYNAEWDCIPASAVGAPHRRDRIFIIAYPDDQNEYGVSIYDEARKSLSQFKENDCAYSSSEGSQIGDSGQVQEHKEELRPERLGEDVAYSDSKLLHGTVGKKRGGQPSNSSSEVSDTGCELLEGRKPSWPIDRSQIWCYSRWWATEPEIRRVANGIPKRVDRLKGLGNAVVPQVGELVGDILTRHERLKND